MAPTREGGPERMQTSKAVAANLESYRMLQYRHTRRNQLVLPFFDPDPYAYLVEFAVKTAYQLAEILIVLFEYPLPGLVPKSRIFALFLVAVLEREVQICDIGLPKDFVFFLSERRGIVRESVEAYQVRHTF